MKRDCAERLPLHSCMNESYGDIGMPHSVRWATCPWSAARSAPPVALNSPELLNIVTQDLNLGVHEATAIEKMRQLRQLELSGSCVPAPVMDSIGVTRRAAGPLRSCPSSIFVFVLYYLHQSLARWLRVRVDTEVLHQRLHLLCLDLLLVLVWQTCTSLDAQFDADKQE